jgi:hypothetical protein
MDNRLYTFVILIFSFFLISNTLWGEDLTKKIQLAKFLKYGDTKYFNSFLSKSDNRSSEINISEYLKNYKYSYQSDNSDTKDKLAKTAADNEFLLKEEITEYWFGPEISKNKATFDHDMRGNRTIVTSAEWVEENWLKRGQELYKYDEADREIEFLFKYWENSDWINNHKNASTYNSNNKVDEKNGYFWIDDEWSAGYRVKFTYNEKNNEIMMLEEALEGSEWIESYKTETAYDENNNPTQIVFSYRFAAGLEEAERIILNYDQNNNLIDETFQMKDGSNWVNIDKTSYQYDDNQNQISTLSMFWNESNWENSYKASLTYNEFNNQTGFSGSFWEDGKWILSNKGTFTYDENQNNTLYLFERLNGVFWEPFIRITSTYEKLVTDLIELDQAIPEYYALSQNYPNPFNPSTNIEFSIPERSNVSIKVYDIIGREIAVLVDEVKDAGSYSVNFRNSTLASGTYIYNFEANGNVLTKKMTFLK